MGMEIVLISQLYPSFTDVISCSYVTSKITEKYFSQILFNIHFSINTISLNIT